MNKAHQKNNKVTVGSKGIGTLILITDLGVASQRRVTTVGSRAAVKASCL